MGVWVRNVQDYACARVCTPGGQGCDIMPCKEGDVTMRSGTRMSTVHPGWRIAAPWRLQRAPCWAPLETWGHRHRPAGVVPLRWVPGFRNMPPCRKWTRPPRHGLPLQRGRMAGRALRPDGMRGSSEARRVTKEGSGKHRPFLKRLSRFVTLYGCRHCEEKAGNCVMPRPFGTTLGVVTCGFRREAWKN